jgi:hypothetical protein
VHNALITTIAVADHREELRRNSGWALAAACAMMQNILQQRARCAAVRRVGVPTHRLAAHCLCVPIELSVVRRAVGGGEQSGHGWAVSEGVPQGWRRWEGRRWKGCEYRAGKQRQATAIVCAVCARYSANTRGVCACAQLLWRTGGATAQRRWAVQNILQHAASAAGNGLSGRAAAPQHAQRGRYALVKPYTNVRSRVLSHRGRREWTAK